jgi:hypothetical protein
LSDYRNSPLKFLNAGLDLNLPPEGLQDFTWRKLDNIRVRTESVMESRPHTQDFFTSSYFSKKTYTWNGGGRDYSVVYPGSYYLGPLIHIAYVGKLKSGEDAFLTIHTPANQTAWPYETGDNQRFSCFLNGMPIVEIDIRTNNNLRPPLTLSQLPTSIVRINSPNGGQEVIIDGRWKVAPGEVDINNPPTDWNFQGWTGGEVPVLAYSAPFPLGQNLVAPPGTVRCIPAYRVGSGVEPHYPQGETGTINPYNCVGASATTTTTVGANGPLTYNGAYDYRVTMKNKAKGTRSLASLASGQDTITSTNSGALLVSAYYPIDPQMDQIEIWRRGGTIGDSFRLVTTLDDPRYGSNAAPLPLVYTDTYADLDISLNEQLDATLLRPFPATDEIGTVYRLLDNNSVVYATGTVTVTNSSKVVQGIGTSGETNYSPALFTTNIVGYDFRVPPTDTPYIVAKATAASTSAASQLELSTTYAGTSVGGTTYSISRDRVRPIAFGPFQGQYVFWLGDPVKKGAFYWNNANRIDLCSPDLNYNLINDPGEELVNGFIFGGNPYVFSKRKLYALDFGGPTATPAFVPREVPLGVGLAGKWAFASSKLGVIFLSWDGIYVTDCGGGPPTKLSENLNPIFRGIGVADVPAVDWTYVNDFRICLTSRDAYFYYRSTGGAWNSLVCDLTELRWNRWLPGREFRMAYELENASQYRVVFGSDTAAAYYSDDVNVNSTEETLPCTVRTASWDSGIPLTNKEFGVLLLDFDPDGAEITITPRYNSDTETGIQFTTGTAGDTAGRRTTSFSLGDIFRRSLSLEFSWTDTGTAHPEFFQGTILFREDEEAIVHWALPPTALGQGGWFHIKDSYWTLKSTAAVTLTVNVDGVEDTYTIPSTAGLRLKQYVEFTPRRGKLFAFKLESTAAFYFYGEESSLNGKPWKTATGYQPLNPFGAAGYAQYLRNEGGT